jgi:hypothetical protein
VGRYFIALSAACALSIITASVSLAQGGPQKNSGRRFGGPAHRGNEMRGAQQRFFQLSPDERQAFKRNAERWLKMDQQQRNMLRERERMRREQMRVEAEAALRDSGLRLDPNARDQFESRYFQERRRIERELRQEIETKRQQQLPELKERLKSEFQTQQPAPALSTAPAGSGKPKR